MNIIWFAVGLHFLVARCCSQYVYLNCDAPASSTYTCAVDSETQPVFAACSDQSFGLTFGTNCSVLAGSSLTIVCTNQSLVLYKNDISLGSFSVQYDYVTAPSSGLYECRLVNKNNETEVLYSRTVEINNVPTVGLECVMPENLHGNGIYDCCGAAGQSFPLYVNVFCDTCNVSVGVEWIDHIAVDLDLQLIRQSARSTIYTVSFGPKNQVPHVVKSYDPYVYSVNVVIWVNISNEATSSACFPYAFYDTNGLYAKLIVPSTDEIALGADAIFQCEYSYAPGSLLPAYIQVELHLTNGTDYTALCNSSSCIGNMTLNIAQRIDNSATVYISTLNVSALTSLYNNSQIACSLWFSDVVQWRNVSTLVISPAMPLILQSTPPQIPADILRLSMPTCPSYCQGLVGGLLSGGALIGGIILVCILLVVCMRKIQRKPTLDDAVEFKNDGYVSVLVSIDTQPQKTLGSEFKSETDMVGKATVGRSWKSLSLSDAKNVGKYHKSSRIYVSYCEDAWSWVSGYLKPLIQKLVLGSEVTVHTNDMIAGHPISEERMRLILEADKVLIVCSPGYEHSPWCQYELHQSVSKDPGLMEQRIISILCDGCSAVPHIISGVVPIRDDDSMFESKLQQCLNKVHV